MKSVVLLKRVMGLCAAALMVALLCGTAGFLYDYRPQRDQLAVSLEGPSSPPDVIAAGTVSRVGGGRIAIDTATAGTQEFALPASATFEELRPLLPSVLTPGMRVNIGAERSDFGVAITGIVLVRSAR